MRDICLNIGVFLISIISGILSMRITNRYMEDKISPHSFEYRIFGFCCDLVFASGMIFIIANNLVKITNVFYNVLIK